MLTPAEKRANTKAMQVVKEYIDDLIDQITNQYPQSNGDIYLHGELITPSRVNRAIREYNEYVAVRNSYAKDRIPVMETISWRFIEDRQLIRKHSKSRIIEQEAKASGLPVVTLHPVVCDPCEFKGFSIKVN